MGLMHWIQDCSHASDDPDSVTFDEEALAEAQSHALVHKSDINLVNTNSKAADPGKFKDEHKWPEWSKAFANYLFVIPGVNGIPLSYVVHEGQDPEDGVEYLTFTEWMVAHAPLKGQYFEANSHHFHTLLTGFLQGKLTENWIHPFVHHQDGCHDKIALHNHYAGKGNSPHHISDANWIRSTLHNKSKQALPFSKFLDSMQKMFTIFHLFSPEIGKKSHAKQQDPRKTYIHEFPTYVKTIQSLT